MPEYRIERHYVNGELAKSIIPKTDGWDMADIVAMSSLAGGLDMAFGIYPYQYKINGAIYLTVDYDKIYVDYDITPLEAIPQLEQELSRFYTIQKNGDA
jgi:hypothetical protein